ncbi:toll-like receptor 10 [Perognathus longimembris pacificus]|uniref:toll-like receptor 10 n=1 Tax=Perognathus longimembris pacificus TaxID=214514 RepID=UPI002019BCF2|nr:toll-like receptor 10 [Perognathus longimembris pacificus]
MGLAINLYIFCNIVMSVESWAPKLPEERELTTNCSNLSLNKVPSNLAPATITLDLSYNLLFQLQSSDFHPMSKLRVLILCQNRIQQLDFKIFALNKELQYLDVSYNRLKIITWYSLEGLKHLDLSFNDFDTMPLNNLEHMEHLETLGLSAATIRRSDLQKIAHWHLHTVFLGLRILSQYEEGSLPILNTTKLHIVLPVNIHFWVLLCDGIKTSQILEITNIDGKSQFVRNRTPPVLTLENAKASTLLLNQVDLLWDDLLRIFQFVWHTSVEYFQIKNVTLGGNVYLDHHSFDYSNTTMKAVQLEHVHFRMFSIPQDKIYLLFTNMDVENLTISGAQMPHMLFPNHPQHFQYLNFANNVLNDDLFKTPTQLPFLKTLVLKGNKLQTFSLVSRFANNTPLMQLDVSQNLLQHREAEDCLWPATLTTMNLSSNQFADSVFKCLPASIQILDLYNNKIQTIPTELIHLQSLRELNIALNFLTDLPGCNHFTGLSVLNIEMNLIVSPSLDFFQSCHKIKTLNAGKNPFRCTCDLREFIQFEKHSEDVMVGWSDSYTCEYPLNLKGTHLKDVYLPELSCNITLLIITIVAIMLVLGAMIAFFCLHFDLFWYVRMLGQWTQHRARKARREQPERNAQFHAFISYTEHDSLWVKNELIPNLEKEDGSVLICLLERQVDPGKSIDENIMSCLDRSWKSIFVLSPDFVQHEWHHYELYFACHNLLHENSDRVILILLEPIPPYCIPARFPMLKALMEKKAYLEWPKDRRKCRLFWANLRAAINIHLSDARQMYELQTFIELSQESPRGSTISLLRTDCL